MLHSKLPSSVVPVTPAHSAHTVVGRAWRVGFVGIVALVATACGDDSVTGFANNENQARTVSVYALSGTAPALPAAYHFTSELLVRPQLLASGAVNFEVAFDLAANGQVSLIPARIVVPEAPVTPPAIGIQKSDITYRELLRAPDRGYVTDSVITGVVGDTFVLQLLSSGCTFGEPLYLKLAIDSVIVSQRRIVFTSMVNRNCGFRGLVAGLPTD